jgi:protease-4
MAKAAQEAGLVDRLGDRNAFSKRLAEIVGTQDESVPASFKAIKYDNWIAGNPSSTAGGEIGVLPIVGEIVDGSADPGTAGAETIVRNLERGLKAGNLKALVVRVDSPGGSVLASEGSGRPLLEAKAQGLPIVVSMGSVAASGGYWVAMPADRVFAEPETITGSIGVFGILPSFQGSLEKLGVGADGVKTTPLSGEPDLLRGPSPEANQLLQLGVENTYRRFISLVAAARKMPPEQVQRAAKAAYGTVERLGSLASSTASGLWTPQSPTQREGQSWIRKRCGPSIWKASRITSPGC